MPERAIAAEEFAAFVVNVTFPATLAAEAGVNVTFNVAFWPGFNMRPFDAPVALKPAPETLTLENVIAPAPVFESVND